MVFMIIGPRQTTGVLSSTRKPMLITFTPCRSIRNEGLALDLGPRAVQTDHQGHAWAIDVAIHQADAPRLALKLE